MNCNPPNPEPEDASSASLLELAANNDLEGFQRYIDRESSTIDSIGLWYGRQKNSNQMVIQHRTPLMVSATYGSIEVLKLIISSPEVDVNRRSEVDGSTALHCAASSGSVNAVNIVKLLLEAGADPNLADTNNFLPRDVFFVPPKLQETKYTLQMMLSTDDSNLNSNSPPVSPDRVNRKEYPIDPSLPDINNSIYSTDEFRMFSFKVRPCSRAYSHDWTECPFVHPGENARRRDPRKFHYSCVPCPEFRKGACRRGDMCEYAHGVFESWLHPAQYRTRLCKDGTSCNRRVCFFAHIQEELRPLYVSTGSAVPSPRSSNNSVDFMSLLPGSPIMSPSNNGIPNMGLGWPQPQQQNVPALHLPGSNFQSSRLRSSLNAREIHELSLFQEIDAQKHQLLNELSHMSHNPNINRVRPKTLNPTSLEDIFSAEGSSSPRYSDQSLVFSPNHRSGVLNQFQQQQQSMLSPIKTNFSPRNNLDHSLMQQQGHFGLPSPGRMSPRNVDPISPMGGARMSMIAQHHHNQHQQFRSLSSRDLGSSGAANNWGSPNGPAEWAVTGDGLGKLKRSSSFEAVNNGEEPDLSWVQSLVKESPQDVMEKKSASSVVVNGNTQSEQQVDESVLGEWIEQMQLDQLMAK